MKGSLPGMCYYQADGNELYEWDDSSWVAVAIDDDAFHAMYDFATLFNTSTTDDPRPDLSGDGVTLV